MLESLQTSTQLTTVVEVDLTSIARLRSQEKDDCQRRNRGKAVLPCHSSSPPPSKRSPSIP